MTLLSNNLASFRGNPQQSQGGRPNLRFGQSSETPEKIVIPIPDEGNWKITIVDEPSDKNPEGYRISFIA